MTHVPDSPLRQPVVIMAGGTGGHIFPGLAVAGELRLQNVDVLWLGSSHGMENTLVPEHGYAMESISIAGLRGRGFKVLLGAPFRLFKAVRQARRIFQRYQPRSVLSMGGFAAGPGGLAAWVSRRPLVVHEQNSVPGLTNRVLARLAQRVLTGFPGNLGDKSVNAGNPVRSAISQLPEPAQRMAHRSGPIRLLVLGGSQGAAALNENVPAAVAALSPGLAVEIRHQCGRGNEAATEQAYAKAAVPARIEPFVADMAHAYQWADLVICRAGALTVAELAAAGLASVLVPFPHAVDDHQTSNARYLVDAGAAMLCPQSRLTVSHLASLLEDLFRCRQNLLNMATRARGLARPQAAASVARACLEVAQ